MDKRRAQAVTSSVPTVTGKTRRVHREDAAPQGVGLETDAEASACAVRLVATAEGVAATVVEHDHRALEARSERPVRADVAVAVGTAPRPLGPGCAPRQMVVPIHPALPFGVERRRRTSRRWREGKATPAVAATAGRKPARGACLTCP